jgi:uncharacterized protein DUF5658
MLASARGKLALPDIALPTRLSGRPHGASPTSRFGPRDAWLFAGALVTALLVSTPSSAQTAAPDAAAAPWLDSRPLQITLLPDSPTERASGLSVLMLRAVDPPKSGHALMPLYFSFAGLEGLDYASTTRALDTRAGRESNPVTRSIVRSRLLLLGAKAAATAAVVAAGEKLWKRHRIAAAIFVGGLNAAMLGVVAHNYGVDHRR